MTLIGYVFWKLETTKDVLIKCLKIFASEHLATVNMLNSLKTNTTAIPSYCFINLAKFELENVCISVSEILPMFVNTLTAEY